ncbi:MAG: DNA gyrase subunit A [Spirochaetes bacterium]|nr:DNA gyrase subunit A [Spirochaetota bacterium]
MATNASNEYFETQINEDQCKYSRYVCDSRAIPNEIDGLKPVQRRILWTMWNSSARNTYTKTVKVAGLVMGYHPHGDRSIQDAISAMAQEFPFANNYALIAGEGTFGDVLDPSAIASPRYTEVRLSDFAKDVGLFECLDDIEYIPNYDETEKEPVFLVAKIPLVLINPAQGIATGFRCSIPSFRLGDVVDALTKYLKKGTVPKLTPWIKGYGGKVSYQKNEAKSLVVTTTFNVAVEKNIPYITDAPQGYNRERVIGLLEKLLDGKADWLNNYTDYSHDRFHIELQLKRGVKPVPEQLTGLLDVVTNDVCAYNMITSEGKLEEIHPDDVIRHFAAYRKAHLRKRFKRLALIEQEKIDRNNELIRFINEGWNKKVVNIKSKSALETELKKAKFIYYEWLASLPIYRLTADEVDKCKNIIAAAKAELARYNGMVKSEDKLIDFIIAELADLKAKWDNV